MQYDKEHCCAVNTVCGELHLSIFNKIFDLKNDIENLEFQVSWSR